MDIFESGCSSLTSRKKRADWKREKCSKLTNEYLRKKEKSHD
jgi:hypothetical protein